MNALTQCRISIYTSIEQTFFERELDVPYDYYRSELDCGCEQTSALEIDINKTYQRIAAIEEERDRNIIKYCQLLEASGVDCVISDIAALPLTIAKKNNIPSLAISNFTWAEIYTDYVTEEPRFADILSLMESDYKNASAYIRLYPGMNKHPFLNIKDVSLLCRHTAIEKSLFFEQLNLDTSKKTGLIYIGQYGLHGSHWQHLANYEDWQFVGIYPLPGNPSNYSHIQIENRSVQYSDLVAHSDLVIAKLGYGVVSECLYWHKPIAYPPRKQFSEFDTLEAAIKMHGLDIALTTTQLQLCMLDDVLCSHIDKNTNATFNTSEHEIVGIIAEVYQSHVNKLI